MKLREWPGRAIPVTPEQVDEAIRALFARANWKDPITKDVVRELQKWFDADWCVDAILVALDYRPDQSRQAHRGGRDLDLASYLRNRLAAWFNDKDSADSSTTRLPPPRPGMSLEVWLRVNQRNRCTSQPRQQPKLGEEGEQARQYVRDFAASRRRDPVARNREKDAAVRAAMDRLLPPGATAADPSMELDVTPTPRHRLEAGYAGRRAVVNDDPNVHKIITRLSQQRRRPTPAERDVLRNAIEGARDTACLAELEALTANLGEILSPEALHILRYYDHSLADDLSLDSMIALLTAMVEDEHPHAS